MDDKEEYQSKISTAEFIMIGGVLFVLDIVEIVLDWILIYFGADNVVNIVSGIIFAPFIGYCKLRGIPITAIVVADILEFVPYVGDFFPTKTIGWCVTFYQDRNPESMASKAITAGTAVAGAVTSKTGGAAGAQKAAGAAERAATRGVQAAAGAERGVASAGRAAATTGREGARQTWRQQETAVARGSLEKAAAGQGVSLSRMLGEHENELERFQSQVFQTPGQKPAAANDNAPVQSEEMAQAA